MGLKAVIEVVVHFESFRNIELFYQGLYYLQCKLHPISPTEGEPKQYAAPHCSFISHVQHQKNLNNSRKASQSAGPVFDHHNLLPHKICAESNSFRTKTFLIRYCEEEVEINDIVLFRCELDVEPGYLNRDF